MEFNYGVLRGKIKEKSLTEYQVAELLEISKTSFSNKINNKLQFTQEEIEKLVNILEIEKEKIALYFFNTKVQK